MLGAENPGHFTPTVFIPVLPRPGARRPGMWTRKSANLQLQLPISNPRAVPGVLGEPGVSWKESRRGARQEVTGASVIDGMSGSERAQNGSSPERASGRTIAENPCSTRAAERRYCGEWLPSPHWNGSSCIAPENRLCVGQRPWARLWRGPEDAGHCSSCFVCADSVGRLEAAAHCVKPGRDNRLRDGPGVGNDAARRTGIREDAEHTSPSHKQLNRPDFGSQPPTPPLSPSPGSYEYNRCVSVVLID